MKKPAGKYVRVVVSLPEETIKKLEEVQVPLSLYLKERMGLLLNDVNVATSLFARDMKDRRKKKSVGLYLHEKEYKQLLYHLRHLNSVMSKRIKRRAIKVNQLLYRLLTDQNAEEEP